MLSYTGFNLLYKHKCIHNFVFYLFYPKEGYIKSLEPVQGGAPGKVLYIYGVELPKECRFNMNIICVILFNCTIYEPNQC